MNWNRRYAIKSYLLSTIWTAPVVALVLEQATFRLMSMENFDFGWIPGFAREGAIAGADYVIASTIAFIVFTFSSLLVAIQVASGQLTPRIIATTLLRDSGIRWSVALFVYTLASAVAVKSRVDVIPHSFVSLMGILGLSSVVVFLFLIDHAARLLRPVSIIGRVAQQGLKVFDDVYPNPIRASSIPTQAVDKLGPPQRTVSHRGSSAIVIAVNLKALVAEAKRADVLIEVAPRMGDFVARDDPLFVLRGGGAMVIDERKLLGHVAFDPSAPLNRIRRLHFASLSTSQSRRCRRQSTIQPPPCSPSTSFSACCVQQAIGIYTMRGYSIATGVSG